MRPVFHFCLLILLLGLFIPDNLAYAQTTEDNNVRIEDDQVKPLGEILNPKTDKLDENLTVDERGNLYFERCMAKESLAFDPEEKEIICACTAAKLGEIITAPEFPHLYKDTTTGEKARMKVITYAYTECIDYAITDKMYKDCAILPLMQKISYGRTRVCECAIGHYNKLLIEGTAHWIMEGIKHSPMTLNPLEHYFTSDAYYNSLLDYAKVCRAQMLYDKNN